MRKAYFLLILLMLFPVYAFAQRTVSGVVQDETGEPLIGVTVQVVGEGTGVITDVNGRYTITAPEGSTLRFSFMGMRAQEHRVTATTSVLHITLQLDAEVLGDVVVTAMGIVQERARMNFAVQAVSGETLNEGAHANIATALAGRVANLQVTTAGGSPNSGTQMILRGISSMNNVFQNEPLFVLDGIPLAGGSTALQDINPSDVENVTVLKGAAASALYGQAAANGVIMITTRQAQAGRITATAGMSFQWDTPWRLPGVQTTFGPGAQGIYHRNSAGGWGPPLGPDEQRFDNVRNALQTGFFQRYDFSLSGGSERFSAVASVNYSRNHGIVLNDFRNTTNAMMRGTFRPFENLSISASLHLTDVVSRGGFGTSALQSLFNWPINDDITDWREHPTSQFPRRRHFNDGATNRPGSPISPMFARHMDHSQSNRLRNIWNASVNWTPINNLEIIGRVGFDTTNESNFSYTVPRWDRSVVFDLTPPTAPTLAADPPMPQEPLCPRDPETLVTDPACAADWARFDQQMAERAAIIAQNLAAYNAARDRYAQAREDLAARYLDYRSPENTNFLSNLDINAMSRIPGTDNYIGGHFGQITHSNSRSRHLRGSLLVNYTLDLPNDIQLGFLGGTDIRMSDGISSSMRGRDFLIPGTFSFQNINPELTLPGDRTASRTTLYRTFGYFGEVRMDWRRMASLSVSGRWDWSSTINLNPFFYPSVTGGLLFTEMFDIANDIFTFGRLRGNFAMVGRDAPAAIFDRRFRLMEAPGEGFIINAGMSSGDWGIQPEISHSWEVGADLRFFRGRTRLDMAYYSVRSDNQIVIVRVSTASGHILQVRNEGSIRNHGVEFTLDQDIIRRDNFTWTAGINFGLNRGYVVSLPEYLNDLAGEQFGTIFTAAFPGGSTTSLLGTDYLRNDAGRVIVDGATGFPLVDPMNRRHIGNREPLFSAGLTNTFNFRGVNLSFLFDGRLGGDVANITKRGLFSSGQHPMLEQYRGRQIVFDGVVRQPDGSYRPNTTPITIDQQTFINSFWTVCTNFIEDGSFIRLNFVTLSYDLVPHINLPQLSSLRVSATASNLFMLTRYTGSTPLINANVWAGGTGSAGIDNWGMPQTRGFNLGISATF